MLVLSAIVVCLFAAGQYGEGVCKVMGGILSKMASSILEVS